MTVLMFLKQLESITYSTTVCHHSLFTVIRLMKVEVCQYLVFCKTFSVFASKPIKMNKTDKNKQPNEQSKASIHVPSNWGSRKLNVPQTGQCRSSYLKTSPTDIFPFAWIAKKNFFKNISIELACLQMQTCELVNMHNCILADFEVCKTCATNADLLSEYHDTYSYATGIIDGLPEH